ncbi:MAG: universal stress protein [Candidatus Micrarchaeota archaeon]
MYSKIVVGLDGSKSSWVAFAQSVALAKKFGSQLLIVSVLPFADDVEARKQFMALRKRFSLIQQKALKICSNKRVKRKSFLLEGEAGEEILDFSVKEKANLIVVGRWRDAVYGRFLFGKVSYYLVERAKVPVLVVKS